MVVVPVAKAPPRGTLIHSVHRTRAQLEIKYSWTLPWESMTGFLVQSDKRKQRTQQGDDLNWHHAHLTALWRIRLNFPVLLMHWEEMEPFSGLTINLYIWKYLANRVTHLICYWLVACESTDTANQYQVRRCSYSTFGNWIEPQCCRFVSSKIFFYLFILSLPC